MAHLPASYRIDLDAYFQRIGHTGLRTPTLTTLRALQGRHTQTIPFENLDPWQHRSVSLDLRLIEAKLVNSRRGGYCYEQNLLFSHVLQRLGYEVTNLAARVLWGRREDDYPPRSHMLLRVTLDQRAYIVDVGFGGNTLTAPLLLDNDMPQQTSHGVYRILRVGGDYLLQAEIHNEWRALYRFDSTPHFPVDYEAMNYYLSTHDASHFRHSLYAAISTADGSRSLLNDRLSIRDLDGNTQQLQLDDAEEAAAILLEAFGIEVPDRDLFVAAWSRLRQ